MKVRKDYTCPLEVVHDLIKGKWKTIIIFNLRKGKQSFTELLHSINGISEKMLIEQLKELQDFSLFCKNTFDGYPLKVEYYLSDRGTKLLNAVKIMQDIGIEYMIENGMKDILVQKGICLK